MKYKLIIKIFFWFIVLGVSFVLLDISVKNFIHSNKEVVVPNVEGKSIIDALNIVSRSGLGLKKIGESFDPNLPMGTVITQNPKFGMVVREGRYINVIVSLGGEKVFVPNLIGEERRKAEILLRQYNLIVGTVTETYSLKYQKNKIMSQDPPESSVVDRNTAVNFVISRGIPPENIILMPDFVARQVEDAQKWAQTYGLEIRIVETISDYGQSNFVISQKPLPDTVVTSNDIIEIVVPKIFEDTKISGETKEPNFIYEIPPIGTAAKNVKIVQVSTDGEKNLYNQLTLPGSKIALYILPKKNAKVRIFIDGVLIDEK